MAWSGRLVVATPLLTDPSFARSVVLLLEHDDREGAVGVVLNRPAGTPVAQVLPAWEPLAAVPEVLFSGGPVSTTSAVALGRARRPADAPGEGYAPLAGLPGVGTMDLQADPDPLRAVLAGVRVFLGYAGWGGGQLEDEVAQQAWWVLDALPGDPFSGDPQRLWSQVLRRQGPPLAFAALHPDDPSLN